MYNTILFILWIAGMVTLLISILSPIEQVHSIVMALWTLPAGHGAGAAYVSLKDYHA